MDSCVAISFCASSLRCSDKSDSRWNSSRFERMRYKLVSTIGTSVASRNSSTCRCTRSVNLLDAFARLLFGFVVGYQLTRHRDTQGGLMRLQ